MHERLSTSRADASEHKYQFKVSGMACGNCALAIEKKLKGTCGVHTASVNFANEMVMVNYDPRIVDLSGIFRQIRNAGYVPKENRREVEEDRTALKQRDMVIFSAVFSLPIMPMMWFLPASQFLTFSTFAMATIVQFGAGWTFYRGAYLSLKNKSANMDVLRGHRDYGRLRLQPPHDLSAYLF